MDRITQSKIGSLRYRLRQLPEDKLPSVDELARAYQLDPFMVRRIAQAEDIRLRDEGPPVPLADPRAPTGVIGLEDVPLDLGAFTKSD